MTIKQLSIFIENRNGALLEVLETLKDNGIDIIVSTLGDTDGFGIYRIICTEPIKAFRTLREKSIPATISDVFAIRLNENKPGEAAKIVAKLTASGVAFRYLYSFLYGGKGILVFRTDNKEKAEEAIMLNKIDFITESLLSCES